MKFLEAVFRMRAPREDTLPDPDRPLACEGNRRPRLFAGAVPLRVRHHFNAGFSRPPTSRLMGRF